MSLAVANTEAVILGRAIDATNGNLSPEAARSILEIKLPESDCLRLHELAEKAADATLSDNEERELENYRNVGRLLELLKSKARLSLRALESSA
jgi:hypothetical protein